MAYKAWYKAFLFCRLTWDCIFFSLSHRHGWRQHFVWMVMVYYQRCLWHAFPIVTSYSPNGMGVTWAGRQCAWQQQTGCCPLGISLGKQAETQWM